MLLLELLLLLLWRCCCCFSGAAATAAPLINACPRRAARPIRWLSEIELLFLALPSSLRPSLHQSAHVTTEQFKLQRGTARSDHRLHKQDGEKRFRVAIVYKGSGLNQFDT